MINIGGKVNDNNCNSYFSIYDFENLQWYEVPGLPCFRHVSFAHGTKLNVHGGLNNNNELLGNGNL